MEADRGSERLAEFKELMLRSGSESKQVDLFSPRRDIRE